MQILLDSRAGFKFIYIQVCIHTSEDEMASKTITISEEAYEILKRRKRKNESFTDVIIRLGSERATIAGLLDRARSKDFESISVETAREMKGASKEFRENFKLRDTRLLFPGLQV
jgi:predicted CopG family antitoxin